MTEGQLHEATMQGCSASCTEMLLCQACILPQSEPWWLTKPTNRRIAFCVSFFRISVPWLCSNRALNPAGARKLGKSRGRPFQCPEIPRKYPTNILFSELRFQESKKATPSDTLSVPLKISRLVWLSGARGGT